MERRSQNKEAQDPIHVQVERYVREGGDIPVIDRGTLGESQSMYRQLFEERERLEEGELARLELIGGKIDEVFDRTVSEDVEEIFIESAHKEVGHDRAEFQELSEQGWDREE